MVASHFKRVMHYVISCCQSNFIPRRQILDEVLVVNVVVDLAKRWKDECLLFKVEFEIDYDSISYSVLFI